MPSQPALRVRPSRVSGLSALALAIKLACHGAVAADLPTGGNVISGAGSISQSEHSLTVLQNTAKLGIEWETFNVGADRKITFIQPDANSIALNRVIGADASRILGAVDANGKVFLINPHGVLFGKNAAVNTGGLLASTLELSNEDFAAGRYTLRHAGSAGSIQNEGSLTAGSVVLVAPSIRNTGTIATPGGNTTLAAGNAVTVSVLANGLLTANVDEAVLDASIINQGRIAADGGSIALQAGTADAVLDSLINTEGVLQARGIEERDGRIFLGAGAGGTAYIGGTVDVSGNDATSSGGKITALGKNVALVEHAVLDASGTNGGGTVLIGGNWQGAGPEHNARAVVMADSARIDASATRSGDGGTVVLWSDAYTNFAGTIAARGGALAGNGGRVETSSKDNLQALGSVDASAALGNAGEWLLDPTNVNISNAVDSGVTTGGANPIVFTPSGASANVQASQINASLSAGTSVTLTTASSGSSVGDININAPITKTGTSDATLTLLANRHIYLNGVAISATDGKLNVVMRARAAGTPTGTEPGRISLDGNIISNGGDITLGGGSAPGGYAYDTGSSGTAIALGNSRVLDARSVSGGGNISTFGKVANGWVAMELVNNSQVLTNGTGTISLRGETVGAGFGMYINGGTTIAAEQGAVDLYGQSTGTFAGLTLSAITVTTTSGPITMTGISSNTNTGLYRNTAAGMATIRSTSGPITLNGAVPVGGIIPVHFAGGTNVSTAGPIVVNAEGGGSGAGIQLDAAGTLSAGTGITLNHTGTTTSPYSLLSTSGMTFATTAGDVMVNAQRAINVGSAISTGNGAVSITNTASTAGQSNILGGISSGGGNIHLSLVGPTQLQGALNAAGGNISVTATSATGAAVTLMADARLQTTGAGSINLTGTNTSTNASGLYLNTGATITSDTGAISIVGINTNTGGIAGAIGTYLNGVTVTSGTGDIYIKGENLGTDVAFYRPVFPTTATNITSTSGNITLEGAGNGPNVAQGILFDSTVAAPVNVTTGGAGKVSVLGRGGTGRWSNDRSFAAIEFGQSGTTGTVVNLTAGTGGIAITGTASGTPTQYILDTYGTGSTMNSAGPITISGDGAVAFGGRITTASTLTVTGNRAYASRLGAVTAAGDVSISTVGDFTLGSFTKQEQATGASSLNISSGTNITTGAINALLGASPLHVTLNSRNTDATSGWVSTVGIVTRGGNIVMGGGSATGDGYAVGAGSTRGVTIAPSSVLDAGGGNITLRGRTSATSTTEGLGVFPNAEITTAGGGNITIDAATAYATRGGTLGAGVKLTTDAGNIDVTGTATGTNSSVGFTFNNGTFTSGSGDISFTGTTNGSAGGLWRDSVTAATNVISASGNISFVGQSTSASGYAGFLTTNTGPFNVTTGGSGSITVVGTGGAATYDGYRSAIAFGGSAGITTVAMSAGTGGISMTGNAAPTADASLWSWRAFASYTSAGGVSITGNKSLDAVGAITAAADVTLSSATGAVMHHGITQNGNGAITLSAATTLSGNATITTTGTGAVNLTAGNALTPAPIVKTGAVAGASTLTIRSDAGITIANGITAQEGSGPLHTILNSRANGAAVGAIAIDSAITTRGGDVIGHGGTSAAGEAIGSGAYGVGISNVTIDAGGGTIEFIARSLSSGAAMNFNDGHQLLTSGSGAIRLQGRTEGTGRGVSIGTSTMTAGTGGISIVGASNSASAVAFVAGGHALTTTGDLILDGTSLANNGIWRSTSSTSTFTGANVSLTGHSTGATTSQQGILFTGTGAVSINAGPAGKVTMIGSGGATAPFSSLAAIVFGQSTTVTAPFTINAGTGGVEITGTAATAGTFSFDSFGTTNVINSAGAVSIGGNKSIFFRGTITQSAGGPSSVVAASGNIIVSRFAQNGGPLTLQAPAGYIESPNGLTAAGDLTVAAGNRLLAGPISAGGALTASAATTITTGTINLTGSAANSVSAGTTLATGAITLAGSGDLTLFSAGALTPAAITKTSAATGPSTVTIRTNDQILIDNAITAHSGAGPLNVVLNSRFNDAAGGPITINSNITTRGGNISGVGGSAGTGPAVAWSGAFWGIGVSNGAIVDAGGGNIDFNATSLSGAAGPAVRVASGQLLTSGAGGITLVGDSRPVGHAGVAFSPGTVVTSGTGGTTITGTAATTYAVAISNNNTLTSTGDITITGTGTGVGGVGVNITSTSLVDVTAGGNLTITARQTVADAATSNAMAIVGAGTVRLRSGATGAVAISGTNTSTGASSVPISFGVSATPAAVQIVGGTGGVTLAGTTASTTANAITSFGAAGSIVADGPVRLTGNRGISFLSPVTANTTAGTITVYPSAGNVTLGALTADGDILVNTPGTFTSSANITARGTANITLRTSGLTGFTGLASGSHLLRLEPYESASAIAIGGVSGALQLPASMFNGASRRFADGFSEIVIGRGDGSSAIGLGSVTFTDPVTLLAPVAGSLNASGTVYNTGGGLTARVGGSIVLGASHTIATSGGANNDIVLSSSTLFDQTGTPNPLVPSAGRWIVYLPDPGAADFGSTPLVSGNDALWGSNFDALPPQSVPAGNRYVFNLSPHLNIFTTAATKTYGDDGSAIVAGAVAAQFAPQVTAMNGWGIAYNAISPTQAMGDVSQFAPTSTGSATTANVGTYAIGLGNQPSLLASGFSANYSAPGLLTVDPRPITVQANAGSTKVYGTDDPAGLASAFGIASGTLVNGNTLTGAMGRVAGETAGSYAFTVGSLAVSDGNGGRNYALTLDSATNPFVITPAPLAATIANQSKVYGADDPGLAAIPVTLSGLVNRTVTDINGNVTTLDDSNLLTAAVASLTRETGEDVGTRHVTDASFDVIGPSSSNYSAPVLDGLTVLEITPAPLTATLPDQTKVYGADDPDLAGIPVTLAGLVERAVSTWNSATPVDVDDSTVSTRVESLTRDPGEAVGARTILAATFGPLVGSGASNYLDPTLANTPALEITPAPLLATIADQTKVYGEDDPALAGIDVTLAGQVNRSVTTWNGATPVVIDDTADVSATVASLTRPADENVGAHAITSATFNPLSGAAAGNYSAPTLDGAPVLAITPAPLIGGIQDQTKLYGDDDPLLAGIPVTLDAVNRTVATWYGSTVIDDTGEVTASVTGLTREVGENVGTYAITGATLSSSTGSRAFNYSTSASFTGTPTLTISQRALTATLADQSKIYGNDDPLLAGIVPALDFVNRTITTWNGEVIVNDAGAISTTVSHLARAAGEDVGAYAITAATFTDLAGSSAGNYLAPTLDDGSMLHITARDLLATLDEQTKVYGADDPALAGIVPSLNIVDRDVMTWNGTVRINDTGEVATSVASLTRTAGEDVGTRDITAATFTPLTGSRAANYAQPILEGTPTLSITAAPLSATIDPQSKVYGEADPSLADITPTLNGLINRTITTWNDGVNVNDSADVRVTLSSLTRAAGEDVGSRDITAATFNPLTGSRAANYLHPTLDGTPRLTISAAPLTAAFADLSKIYGDDDPALAGIAVTLSVVERDISTWNGMVLIDDTDRVQTALTALAREAGESVGTRVITSATFAALGGEAAGNYLPPTLLGTPVLQITPRSLTAALPTLTKVYGNDDPALAGITPTSNAVDRTVATWNGGVAVSDAAKLAVAIADIDREAGEEVGTRAITGVTFGALTGSAASNYLAPTLAGAPTLAITPAPLGGLLGDQTKVYGEADPDWSSIAVTLQPVNRAVTTWDTVEHIDDRGRVSAIVTELRRQAGENVGAYQITAATLDAPTGPAAGNYSNLASVTGSSVLRITPRPITIAAQAGTKVYDGNDSSSVRPVLSAGSLAFDDTLTRLVQTYDSRNAGERTLNVVDYLLGDGNDGRNYTVTLLGAPGTITPKALSAAITVNHKVYDGLLDATGSVGPLIGVITGDDIAVSTPTLLFSDKNVGVGKSVTASNMHLSGLDAGNYTFTTPTGLTANITARMINAINVIAHDRVYDATNVAQISGGTLSNTVAGDDVSLVLGAAAFNNKNVGTSKPVTVTGSSLQGSDAGNYTLAEPSGLTAAITPATLTVLGTAANDRVYDATTGVALNTDGSRLEGVLLSDSVDLASGSAIGAMADKTVGDGKSVTVTGFAIAGTDAANYRLLQPTGLTVNITPRDLPVVGVVALDKVFDTTRNATLDNAHAALAGVLANDDVVLSTAGALGSFDTPDVGNGKPVTASGYAITGVDAGNYNVLQPVGLAAFITPFMLGTNGTSVSGTTAADKIYDGNRTATLDTSGSRLGGLLPGAEDVRLVTSGAIGLFDDKNVGVDKTVTITGFTLTGSDAHNYLLSPTETTTASITPLAIAVRGIVAENKVYDATTAAPLLTSGAFLSAIIGQDDVSLTGAALGAFADKNVGNGKPVTVTGLTLAGSDARNYTLIQPTDLVANITPARLTLDGVVALDKTYDATTATTLFGGTLIGVLPNDAVVVGAGIGAFSDKNVGTNKAVTASGFALHGADAGNYELVQPAGLTASITPASITLGGLSANDKVYDASVTATLSGDAALEGRLGNDDLVVLGTPTATFADKNVGAGIAVSVFGYALGGADAGNYTLAQPMGLTADITPASLSILGMTAANKVYDATTDAALTGGILSGVLGTDVVALMAGEGQFVDKNVGTAKAVLVTGYALTGADAGNYHLAQPDDVTADITPAALTITGVTARSKLYDATIDAILTAGSLAGVLGEDDVVLAQGRGTFADQHVGTGKTVTATGFGVSGIDAGNYVLSQPVGLTADITPARLLVTAAPDTREYDGTTSSRAMPTIAGLQGTDTAIGAQVFATRNAGTSALTPMLLTLEDGNGGNNYEVTLTAGSGTITPRPLTVAAQPDVKTYDGTTASAAMPMLSTGSLVSGDTASWSQVFADPDIGAGKTLLASGFIDDGNDGKNYDLTFVPSDAGAILTQEQSEFALSEAIRRALIARDSNFIQVRGIDRLSDPTQSALDASNPASQAPLTRGSEQESASEPCAASDDSGVRMPERPVAFEQGDSERQGRSCSFF